MTNLAELLVIKLSQTAKYIGGTYGRIERQVINFSFFFCLGIIEQLVIKTWISFDNLQRSFFFLSVWGGVAVKLMERLNDR